MPTARLLCLVITTNSFPELRRRSSAIWRAALQLAAALSLVATSPTRAELFVAESFDYPPMTSLHGKGTGTGFGGAWVEVDSASDYDQVQSGSLPHPTLFSTGNSVASHAPSIAYTDLSRELTNIAGTPGSVVWVSFLVRKDSAVTSSTGDYFGVALYTSGDGLFIGKPGETNTWVISTAGAAPVAGEDSGVAITQATTVFLAVKITFAAGNDTIQLFVNPAPGAAAPAGAAATKSDIDLDQLDALGVLGGEVEWSFDEIRLGTTFADVAPQAGHAGLFSFSAAEYGVAESVGSATVVVTRADGSTGTATVRCATVAGGTATAGSDYTQLSEVLSFGPGETTKTVTIAIATNDASGEPTETVNLALTEPTGGASVGAQATAVLSILPPDSIVPTVAITSPQDGLKTPSAMLEVRGTATDASGIAEVLVQRGSGGMFDDFAPAQGTTDWTTAVTLVPGLNIIRVKAVDGNGNESALALRNVTYILRSPLTVEVAPAGGGSVTKGFLGTTQREVGKSYTILATPARGQVFDRWTGDVASEGAELTFIMREDMQLQASFIANPFRAVNGAYSGLIQSDPATHGSTGRFELALSAGGAFTGKIVVGGATFAISGHFDNDGVSRFGRARLTNLTIDRGNLPSLTLTLGLDFASGQVTGGIVEAGGFTAELAGERPLYNPGSKLPPEMRGEYTVLLPANPANAGAAFPQGDGWATLTVSATGRVKIAGELADGAQLVWHGVLQTGNSLPMHVPLYNNQGSLSGTVTFRETPGTSDLDGLGLHWFRPSAPLASRFQDGWPDGIEIDLIGSRYVPPKAGAGARILPGLAEIDADGNARLTLSGADLSGDIVQSLNISARGRVNVLGPNPEKITLTISSETGAFTGQFVRAPGAPARKFTGVVFQKQDFGAGFFLGPMESGPIDLELAP